MDRPARIRAGCAFAAGAGRRRYFLLVFGDGGGAHPVPFIYLRREARAGGAWERRMWTIMCFTALFLASITSGMKYWNQQSMLDRLDAQIATISKEAQRVRAVVDQVKEQRSHYFA